MDESNCHPSNAFLVRGPDNVQEKHIFFITKSLPYLRSASFVGASMLYPYATNVLTVSHAVCLQSTGFSCNFKPRKKWLKGSIKIFHIFFKMNYYFVSSYFDGCLYKQQKFILLVWGRDLSPFLKNILVAYSENNKVLKHEKTLRKNCQGFILYLYRLSSWRSSSAREFFLTSKNSHWFFQWPQTAVSINPLDYYDIIIKLFGFRLETNRWKH